ncbi:hypothetical protein VUJ46_20050 [Chryseobacterium sp. MYb264]|uniref:hypothetical protein n=1 Tax=Chryseobacterium sp. MYb264 TaxID=2745153 RepID=UPI002E12AE93|nr:hypothetical protein VUJ46_20050 [Chryseobacterium sp. MYb264]
MSKITFIGGEFIERIEGDYRILSDSDIEYNCNLFEAEGIKKGLSYNNPEDIDFGNAFIPIVLIVSSGRDYEFKDKDGYWRLDVRIDNEKRSPQMQRVRLISTKAKVKLKFEVRKGNKTADDDTGIIVADIYNTSNQKIESKKIKTSYGNEFEIEIESFKVSLIKFYADDDDLYFDGGVAHVFCGGIRIGDCQDELKKEDVKSIADLSLEDKAKFMAVVLMESANGKKDLWDIAYIYLNLVGKQGVEKGLSKSSAYSQKQFGYKAHLYNLGFGKEYRGTLCTENNKMKNRTIEEQAQIFSTFKQIEGFKEFCKNNIFVSNPKSFYKDWEGQGYYGDMNIRMHDDRKVWAMASQYFHLQKECKVKDRLIIGLFDSSAIDNNKDPFNEKIRDSTTYIYHTQKIVDYFNRNLNKLPKYKKGDFLSSKTVWKIVEDSPTNEIPPIYLLESRK